MNIPGYILVVDDDEEDHDIMRAACEVLGTAEALKFFYDGHALLKYLKSSGSPPFMILCDINMPHIDGLDLREVICKDVDLRRISIPFIFFSTSASTSQIKKAYDLTVQGFFLKGNSMYVYANRIRQHYYHAVPGPGKPVIVMVHGVTDVGLSWTTLTWKLQDSYDIYMVNARGHGLSDPFTSADDGNTLVKDLVEFLRAMNFVKPILMGHSMGAAIVTRVGAEYPDLAKAIIMLDPRLGSTGPARQNPGRTQCSAAQRASVGPPFCKHVRNSGNIGGTE